MTSGPLVSYALVPVLLLGLPLEFFAARIVGLLALWLALTCCYRLLIAHYDRRSVCVGLTPAAMFLAMTGSPDFNHYSSELIPLLLLGLSAWLLWRDRPSGRALFLGGFVAGLTPWAKLQSAPIAAVLVLVALVRVLRSEGSTKEKTRRGLLLCGATLIPALVLLAAVWRAGVLADFYRSYVVQNLIYAEPGRLRALAPHSHFRQWDFAITGFATVCVGALVSALAAFVSSRRETEKKSGGPVMLPAAWLLIVSIACVLIPGRDFVHYLLLLVPALALLHASALGEQRKSNLPISPWRSGEVATAATIVALGFLNVSAPLPRVWGRLDQNAAIPISELGALTRALTVHEPTLAVWGWNHQVYAEAQARQATRSAYTYWEIVQHPQRDYFRQRYLADFTRNRPAVFVDAVGESTFYFANRANTAHETFPELAALVARDYCQVAELRYARVYARRDLLDTRWIGQEELWRAALSGYASDYLNAAEHQDLNRFTLTKDTVDGRFVMVMRPPAKATWTLHGTEREFRLTYGYLPEAVKHRDGNGTELIVSLTEPHGNVRTLSRFLYDPAHDRNARPTENLRVILPPGYEPGSTLTLETTPGPQNDEAWDWLFVTEVGLLHYPGFLPRQFPAFNRPPDEVDSRLVSLNGPASDPELILHAPSTLRFHLSGTERRLDFQFGFRVGAYQNGGHTDGAIYRVRATPPGGPAQILFERDLDPVARPRDRGRKRAVLELPPLPKGTVLEIIIDPKGSNAWDWTMIHSLRLG
jgi:hypothetical protein